MAPRGGCCSPSWPENVPPFVRRRAVRRRCCASDPWRAPSSIRSNLFRRDRASCATYGRARAAYRYRRYSAVGCRVTANHISCRRPWPNTRNANRHSKVSVGTTRRSIAAMASAWLRRNVRQVCDGGPFAGSCIWRPSTRRARTMNAWGAPQWVLLAHPLDKFAQLMANSAPPWPTARFAAPVGPKPCAMPAQDRVRLNDAGQTEQAWPEQRGSRPQAGAAA
jgi:hypothetical protein